MPSCSIKSHINILMELCVLCVSVANRKWVDQVAGANEWFKHTSQLLFGINYCIVRGQKNSHDKIAVARSKNVCGIMLHHWAAFWIRFGREIDLAVLLIPPWWLQCGLEAWAHRGQAARAQPINRIVAFALKIRWAGDRKDNACDQRQRTHLIHPERFKNHFVSTKTNGEN